VVNALFEPILQCVSRYTATRLVNIKDPLRGLKRASLVLSGVAYSNTTMACNPSYRVSPLQSLMNAAARLICSSSRYAHVCEKFRQVDNLIWTSYFNTTNKTYFFIDVSSSTSDLRSATLYWYWLPVSEVSKYLVPYVAQLVASVISIHVPDPYCLSTVCDRPFSIAVAGILGTLCLSISTVTVYCMPYSLPCILCFMSGVLFVVCRPILLAHVNQVAHVSW